MTQKSSLLIVFALATIPWVHAQPSDKSSLDVVHFESDVRAIFKTHCFHCHGEEEDVGGSLDLRLVRWMQTGGDSGSAVVPGKPDASLLYQKLRDGEMPPDESKLLSDSEIETVRRWIADGAKTLRPEPDTLQDAPIFTPEELQHWSLQPIVRPEVPAVKDPMSVANPIDAFLLSRLEEEGFHFSPRATPETLIRRLSFDLLGLPPNPEEVKRFVAEHDAQAWRKQIDHWLGSERYGERWARHWLDVAGYADSEGYNDADSIRPHAWRYRDYVIKAFNDDKPFDQFIREQLAGDEMVTSPINNLSERDAELLTATGFLRMAPDGTGGSVPDANVAKNETIAETIKIVSSSLMALTVGCAQCHDHRYDPISHEDYYRFRAIFDPAMDWQQWRPPQKRLISLYTDSMRAEAARIEAEAKKLDDARLAKQQEFIDATFEKQLLDIPMDLHEVARTAHKTADKDRTAEQKDVIKKYPKLNVTAGSLYLYDSKAADQIKQMAKEASDLRATKPEEGFVHALTEIPGRVPKSNLFYRGDHEQPKQELEPADLSVISHAAGLSVIPSKDPSLKTTGRRLALARRLTDRNHPLTARAIVNRMWMHHFGRGLVTTPNDFGALGQKPTHPELLDWLATEFIDSGWSVKHIQRLVLTSNAWQQSLRSDNALIAADPDNQWYGGAELTRLDAEVIRDSMLALADRLNNTPFGPAVPVMPDTVGRVVIGIENADAGRPGAVIDMKGEDLRRSVYIQVRRSRPLSVLEVFDLPVMSPNCDRRRPSTNSTQSLLMMNSDGVLDFSRAMATRLQSQNEEDLDRQITAAWELIYSRPASADELEMAKSLVQEQIAIFEALPEYKPDAKKPPARTAKQEALAILCQMLLSSNEFLYVD